MKIRIKGNSIRYRLDKNDVKGLEANGSIREETEFGTTMLCYSIERTKDIKELAAKLENNTITLSVPDAWADELIKTERVGFETYAEISDGKILYLLLEKDFKCLDNSSEDQSANYENPSKEC